MRRLLAIGAVLLSLFTGCAGLQQGRHETIELGWLDRSVFDTPALQEFRTRYDTEQVGLDFIGLLRQSRDSIETLVFLGTWCSDSKRDVPRFLKIADLAGFPPASIRLYGLDRSKKSGDGLTDRYGVTKLPTFIFIRRDEEVGRITEMPQTTLEGDMLSIFVAARGK